MTTQTTFADGTTTYTYDHDGQLTASSNTLTSAAAESYAYDAAGNRVADAGTTNAIGDDNELNSDGTFSYTDDAAGNRISRTRVSSASADDYLVQYVWDARNRLVEVINKDNAGDVTQTVTYTYDTRDRRTSETVTVIGQDAVVTHASSTPPDRRSPWSSMARAT